MRENAFQDVSLMAEALPSWRKLFPYGDEILSLFLYYIKRNFFDEVSF